MIEVPPPSDRQLARRRAATIYGTIVTAADLVAGGDVLDTLDLAVTILITLLAFWLAEEYADQLAEHTQAGRLPSLRQIGSSLGERWSMVTSSFLPLAVLVVARLTGRSPFISAEIALIVAVGLLLIYGHAAGKAAGLRGFSLVLVTVTTGLIGVAMVALKVLITHHHKVF